MRTLNFLLIYVFLCVPPQAYSEFCSKGWNWSGISCFKIFEDTKNHSDAQLECLRHQANLASIQSEEEGAFIYKLTSRETHPSLWIGLYKENEISQLNWIDGSQVSFLKLDSDIKELSTNRTNSQSEPTACGLIRANQSEYRWEWDRCEMKNGYVCRQIEFSFEEASTECPTCQKRLKRRSPFYPRSVRNRDPVNHFSPHGTDRDPFSHFFPHGTDRDRIYRLKQNRVRVLSHEELIELLNRNLQENSQWNHFPPQFASPSVLNLSDSSMASIEEYSLPDGEMEESICQSQGDFSYQDSCYHFESKNETTWEEADALCQERYNGSLLALDHWYEYATVISKLDTPIPQFWMGHKQNSSTWSNGQNMSVLFYKWWEQMPSRSGEGKCGTSFESQNKDEYLQWEDCDENLAFLCEYSSLGQDNPPTSPPTPPPISQHCPIGWIQRNITGIINCYKVFHDPRTWSDAVKHCDMMGSQLLYFADVDEQTFLRFVALFTRLHRPAISSLSAENRFQYFWIGLYQDHDREIMTVGGDKPSYLDIKKRYPIMADYRYCFVADITTFKAWNDICEAYLPYFCKGNPDEMTIIDPLSHPPEEEDEKCPDSLHNDWSYYENACYKIVPRSVREESWENAGVRCQIEGAFLASIQSFDENYWILKKVRKLEDTNLWIGGSNTKVGPFRQTGYRWSDHKPFTWINWEDGEPNELKRMEQCIQFYVHRSGYWNDDNCSRKFGFICKRTLTDTKVTTSAPTTTPLPEIMYCSSGWWPLGDRCIKFFRVTLAFEAARHACEREHSEGELVSIRSQEEQNTLTGILGLHEGSFYIGLLENYGFIWLDQSPVSFTNWNQGEPNGAGRSTYLYDYSYGSTKEECVEMFAGANMGKWNDIPCNIQKEYICQKPKDSVIYRNPYEVKCRGKFSSFMKYREGCYKLSEVEKTWEDSRKACQFLGAQLTNIEYQYEQMFLQNYFRLLTNGSAWIDMRAGKNSELFEWSDGWPVLLTNWGKLEPSRLDGKERCVKYSLSDGQWSVEPCEAKRKFICKQSSEIIPTPDPPIERKCPRDKGWFDFGGSYCYYVEDKEKASWNVAAGRCYEKGGTLASIHSEAEMKYIKRALTHITGHVWIGLTQLRRNVYGWNDGSPLQYTHWNRNEPNDDAEMCVEMISDSRLWNDQDCLSTLSFICKIHKHRLPSDDTITSSNTTTFRTTPSSTTSSTTTTTTTSTTTTTPSTTSTTTTTPSTTSTTTTTPSTTSTTTTTPSTTSTTTSTTTPATTTISSTTTTNFPPPTTPNVPSTLRTSRKRFPRTTYSLPYYDLAQESTTSASGAISHFQSNKNEDASEGLSGGGIAGIVIFFIMALLAVAFFTYTYLKGRRDANRSSYNNVAYTARTAMETVQIYDKDSDSQDGYDN